MKWGKTGTDPPNLKQVQVKGGQSYNENKSGFIPTCSKIAKKQNK